MSLIELCVVMALLSIVLFTLYGLMDTMSNNAVRQSALVIDQERVRLAMLQITRDLRSSDPILPLDTSTESANQVDAAVLDAHGDTIYVRWQLLDKVLSRSILTGQDGAVVSTNAVLTNVINPSSQPVFSYFTQASASVPLDLGSAETQPGDIANCTIRVHVSITAAPEPGPAPFMQQSDAEIRNRLPGGIGC